ncbi:MAG: PAS domain S-box protein [Burkholderiales bacterium]
MRTPPAPWPSPPTPLWQDQWRLLLESTGEGIYGVDLAGHCTFINRAGAQMLGRTAEAVLGHNMHELIHHSHPDGAHYPEAACPIFDAFRRGVPCRIEDDVLWRADGSSFPAEYASHPLIGDDGAVLGAVVTFVDITERKRVQALRAQAAAELEQRVAERTAELSSALAQLRQLSAYLEQVREEERTRIAREIHDELGSLLVALKMDVAWLARRVDDRAPLVDKCQGMTRLIDTAVDNVGRIITDLRPSVLDHQGLWAALEWQAQEFIEAADLCCDWTTQIAADAPEPAGTAAIAVFRIFQEMLSNVGRHAQAGQVRIGIQADAAQLRIEVADDGRGAPAAAFERATAWGVMGMRERASQHGGEVLIDSAPGRGTRVRLTLPLGAPAP